MNITNQVNPPFTRQLLAGALAAALGSFVIPAVFAQAPAAPGSEPTEMLVTANRFAQFSHDTLNSHTLLDRDAILRSGAVSLFDLFSSVPGVQMARTGVDGAQTSLFMRGSNSNHTLILLDGVRLNTASEGAARLENLPLSQIERVEVIRGAQSSLYGADAIGGVIQIFTRSAATDSTTTDNTDTNSRAYEGRIDAGAGTEHSRNAHAGFRARLAQTVIDVDLSHHETDGIPAQNAPVPSTLNAAWQNQSLSLGVQQSLGEHWQLWGRWLATESEKLFDGGDSEASQRSASAGVKGTINARWQSQLQLSRFKDDNLTRQWGESRSTTWRESLQWQNQLTLLNNSNTVMGVDLDSEELDYLSTGAVQNISQRDNNAVFAVHQQGLARFDLTASVRVDDNEQFGEHTTGRLALGTDLGAATSVWVAASTAFKAPTLVDLYVDFPAFFFYANPDLEPEKARSLEAGLRMQALGAGVEINLFRSDIRDLIGADASFSSVTNIGRARIDGLELIASRDILGWQNQLSLTLLDHENRDTGETLLRRPQQQASVRSSRQFGSVNVLLDWQLRGDQADLDPVTFGRSHVGGYGMLNTVLAWHLSPELDLQLKIGNVFDKHYEVVDGFNTLGRHAMVNVRHRF